MTSVEVPVVHRGNVQLCAYGSREPFTSLRSSRWFISSLVRKKKILACLSGKVARP